MNSNVVALISNYRAGGILIDTNLLLVLLVGSVDPRLIGKVGRTQAYSISDYERIREILDCFRLLVVIPQVLTETGNLLKMSSSGDVAASLNREFALVVLREKTREHRTPSRRIATHPSFSRLGYADAAILTAAADRYLVLTADVPLQLAARNSKVGVLPFQWLREF